MPTTETHIVEQLDNVLDPCSCMTDQPVSIVDLGLVNEVSIEGQSVHLELLPTTPMCMYMTQIIDEAAAEVRKLDDVADVEIEENIEDMWRPERMSDDLQEAREQRLDPRLQEEANTA
jgi:metal-sulfur cluster biosynthetic enzyme